MKLDITSLGCVSGEDLARNLALSPELPQPVGQGRLAVVGGGPSILGKIATLRAWDGDIWAINGAWRWCEDNGIDATFYSIDPHHSLSDLVGGVRKAILAPHCHPDVFARLKGAEVYTDKGLLPGPTSAVTSTIVALRSGYEHVTYFGCESSYGDTTHAYKTDEVADLVRVSCDNQDFLTKLELLLQVKQFADVIRTLPTLFAEESGGLLTAMVKTGDYDVTHGPAYMVEKLEGTDAGI